LTYSLKFGPHL